MSHKKTTASGLAMVAAVGAMLAAAPAAAQDEAKRIQELERKLEQSMQLIDRLSRRLDELEKGAGPAPAPRPAPAAPQEARIEALEKSVTQMATAPRGGGDLGVPLHGFADVGYEHSTEPRADGRKSGFVIGNLDLYLTPSFGDRVKTLAELVFEVAEDGSLATDLERVQIGYTVSDALTAWIGRFHTPYGYWHAAFHHGAQIQTAVTRPRFLDFEDKGGILPAHTVGVWGTGQARVGSGRLHYDAYLGNGNRISEGVLDFNAFRDDNSNKLAGFNVGYRPSGSLDGLIFGLHGFREEVAAYEPDGAVASRTRVAMAGGYAYLDMNDWEGIAEYYGFRNDDLSGGTGSHRSWAAFMQLGRTFADRWTPYYRWEKSSLDAGDAYFASQDSGRSYSRHVLGVRYNVNPRAAFKLEANRTREHGEDRSYNEARAQFAIGF